MLDHISVPVSDLARASVFYDAVLRTLGFVRVWSVESAAGYARPGEMNEPFALKQQTEAVATNERFHVAFKAQSKQAVSQFHAVAMRLGAKDDGGFGLHPEYGPNYYAAFVIDLDGNRIEAVYHSATDVEYSELLELTKDTVERSEEHSAAAEGVRLPEPS